ncbi:sensor domain-containing diguanylate cyclase [Nautilia lithotrophica]
MAVFIFSVYYIYYQYKKTENNYLNEQYQLFTHVFETSTISLNNIADTIFFLNINKPEILKIIYQANIDKNKRNVLRAKLTEKLENIYKFLQKYGIRQLHFHLLDEISFLRFHRLDKYGDSLKNIRPSLVYVNKNKKIIRGFEEGRIFNGFRNVYPLFYKGRFIGSVEISFSAKPIINMIYKSYPAFYGLLLKKSDIKKKVWNYLNKDKKYRIESMLDKNLVWDKKVLDFALSLKYLNKDDLKKLEKKFSKIVNFNKKYIYLTAYKNEKYILMILPIKNISGKTIAYFVSIKRDNYLNEQKTLYLLLGIIVTILFIVSGLLLHLYIKKRSKYLDLLKESSYKDPLTKLLNRRGLLKILPKLEKNFSIIFLDIDKFKHINDKYGHKTGDEVLKEIANILQNNLRKEDLIARWGGEEFLIILATGNKKAAMKIAEKLRMNIENNINEHVPKFTASFGVVSNVNKHNFEEKLNQADEYLYKAKNEGRNRVIGQ